jgi:hypothetical protein
MKRSLASTVPLKLNKDLVFQVFKFSFLQVTVSERGKNFSIFGHILLNQFLLQNIKKLASFSLFAKGHSLITF